MAVVLLTACGGGGDDPPSTPAQPVTQLSFGNGATVTLDNVAGQYISFSVRGTTTAQTPTTASSTIPAVVPFLTREDNGFYTLRLQLVDEYRGVASINIKIGDDNYRVNVNVDSTLQLLGETFIFFDTIGYSQSIYLLDEIGRGIYRNGRVKTIDPQIVSETNSARVLATVDVNQTTRNVTITPVSTGQGIARFTIAGLSTEKTVIVKFPGLLARMKSHAFTPTNTNVTSSDFRIQVATFTCEMSDASMCPVSFRGAGADLFEVLQAPTTDGRHQIVAKSYIPAGTYPITVLLNTGQQEKPITVVSTQFVSPPAPAVLDPMPTGPSLANVTIDDENAVSINTATGVVDSLGRPMSFTVS